MSNYKVLIVDDEPDILELLRELLSTLEYQIVTYTNPEEALSYLIEHKNEVVFVISDFMMPEMDGFEFREKMLNVDIDVPFAIYTAFYDVEMATKAMERQVIKFIQKRDINQEVEELITLINVHGKKTEETFEEEHSMVRDFLEESLPMLEEIESLILNLEEDPHNMDAVNTYFRLLHTIKGTASCLNLLDLTSFSHKYEDLIVKIKENKLVVNDVIITILLKGLDVLKAMFDGGMEREYKTENINELLLIFNEENLTKKTGDEALDSGEIAAKKVSKKSEDRVAVPLDVLTGFLEMSGEMTVIKNTIFKNLFALNQKYNGSREIEILLDTMTEMHKVSSNLQTQITELKKISMESVYRSMRRVVRDAANTCHKKIDISFVGDTLKVDTNVGKMLNNILVHVLRNSVDHGVETADIREQAGKDEIGHITLSTQEVGEDIVVKITDDGGGIDEKFIKNKIIEKGLITEEEANKLSKEKILLYIFESGFSTAAKVTEVSGRGVGMDMVRSCVQEFSGKFNIATEIGKGTTFTFTIPTPRSIQIIKALLVNNGEHKFCVSLSRVAEVVRLEEDRKKESLQEIEGAFFLRHHGQLISLIDLSKDLGIAKAKGLDDINNVVVIKCENIKYGIIIDDVDDIEEVVIKKLAPYVENATFYEGVTFVGDGEFALILNLEEIAKAYEFVGIEEECNDFDSNAKLDSKEYLNFSIEDQDSCLIPLSYVYRMDSIKSNRVKATGSHFITKYNDNALPLHFLDRSIRGPKDLTRLSDELNIIIVNAEDKLFGLVVDDVYDIKSSFSTIDESNSSESYLGTLIIDETIFSVLNIKGILGVQHISVDEVINEVPVDKKSDDDIQQAA